jgi:putative ABC transport system permease protein
MGVAISTAVLTGGLIVGDSVKYSLQQTVTFRLGNITHALTSSDRYFTLGLADKLYQKGIPASAALKLKGVASTDGGQLKLNNIQVWGIDDNFSAITGCSKFPDQKGRKGAVAISENMARRLNLKPGDEFQLRIEKGSMIPVNAPFVSDEHQTATSRVTVLAILTREQMGRLSLQNSQTSPYNLILPIEELNQLSEMSGKANTLFINSDQKTSYIESIIRDNWNLTEAGLEIIEASATGEWELRSARVFLDPSIKTLVENTGIPATPLLTYFANKFQSNNCETPYSFVSSLPDGDLSDDETVINTWLANDLKVKEGDSITLFYYQIGPLRELSETSKKFKIKRVEPIKGYYSDRLLMPEIPGLSNVQNCRDWQTGVPINLKSIRKIDEDYWYQYRGLPKAFISYSEASKLWGNRFGNATAYRFSQQDISKENLQRSLMDQLDPFAFDLQLKEVKSEGLYAAQNGTDFSSLFIGLSFFILIAGILLTTLLYTFNIEKRNSEIGTLYSLGFKQKHILKVFLIEGGFISLMGALPGLALAVIYNELVFLGLNRVWNDIVRTDLLISHYRVITLSIGFLISMAVSLITIWLVIKRKLKRSIIQLQRNVVRISNERVVLLKWGVALLMTLTGLGLLTFQLLTSRGVNPELFYMAGGVLLIAFLILSDLFLQERKVDKPSLMTTSRLVFQNLRASRSRSLLVLILLAIGTFIVVSTGLNRQDVLGKWNDKKSGTGGFLYWAESTVPVLHNLNDSTYRRKEGFSESFSTINFSVAEGDDASCLNLNHISNPRIVGVDSHLLKGRFSFQTFDKGIKDVDPWSMLRKDYGNCIPAIADQTVIEWSLGKKVGDTLLYKNSAGEEIRLKLVAGLATSVFQGNVLIDQKQFLLNFPSSSGSRIFLIAGKLDNKESIADELNFNFKELGWEMTSTPERLATFNSIENTYLSIFMALGAFGLLIGTIGLAIVLERSILARKAEFSLLEAIGFKRKKIMGIVVWEYLILLFAGIAGGFITAIIAVWPMVSGGVGEVSIRFVGVMTGIILLNGLVWIIGITLNQMKGLKIVEELRND